MVERNFADGCSTSGKVDVRRTLELLERRLYIVGKTKHMPFFIQNFAENFVYERLLSILCILSPIVIGVCYFIFRNATIMPMSFSIFYFVMSLLTSIFSLCSDDITEHCMPVCLSIVYAFMSISDTVLFLSIHG